MIKGIPLIYLGKRFQDFSNKLINLFSMTINKFIFYDLKL